MIDNIFKGLGQILVIINYILYIPSLIIFENALRCDSDKETEYLNKCFDSSHITLLAFSMISTSVIVILTIYQNIFVNSQFPNQYIPFACWDSKCFMLRSIWKLIYIFHYDLLDPRYYVAIRIGAFVIYA